MFGAKKFPLLFLSTRYQVLRTWRLRGGASHEGDLKDPSGAARIAQDGRRGHFA